VVALKSNVGGSYLQTFIPDFCPDCLNCGLLLTKPGCGLCTVTDTIDENVVATSTELPLESQQHPSSGRVPSASFASDGAMATLTASAMIQPACWKAVGSRLLATPDDSNFELLS